MSIGRSRAGPPYLYTKMGAHRAEAPSLLCFIQRAALSPLTSWSRSATDVSVFFNKQGPFGVTVHAKATASKLNDYYEWTDIHNLFSRGYLEIHVYLPTSCGIAICNPL